MEHGAELDGTTVVVTRPTGQADELVRALEQLGARVVLIPAIEILPARRPAAARRRLDALGPGDWAVFVSPNAVARGVPLFPGGRLPAGVRLAAVGAATAGALERAGAGAVLTGRGNQNSEALLARPELARLEGRQVAILKAPGGRRLLARVLRERGAAVVTVPVYRRGRPVPPSGGHGWQLPPGAPLVGTATSGETLDNLVAMLEPSALKRLRAAPMVVVSERVARRARRHGFDEVVVAGGAGTTAMLRGVTAAVRGSPTAPR